MNSYREEMACLICLVPLNILDGHYIHPIHHPAGDGHTPLPVPVNDLDTIRRTCDFCGDPRPLWTLVGGHVTVVATGIRDLVQNMGEKWAACAPCQTDIDDRRPERVVDRAMRRPDLNNTPGVRERISALHRRFLSQLRPGRTLITTTGWPATALMARDLPRVRDRLAAFYRGSDGLPITLPITRQRPQLADSLDRARLYWIDPTFTELAEQAGQQLPATTFTDFVPCDDGLLVWARPVTARRITAASWTRHDDTYQILTYRTIGAGLDGRPLQRLRDEVGWLAPTRSSHSHDHPIVDHDHDTAALLATWLLIDQKATEIIPAGIDKGTRRSYARAHRPLPDVRIVRVRATTGSSPQPRANTGGDGRTYTNRVWVTGHWRNQPHGPGRTLRRPVYIHPFLRGPDDAPIKLSTTVRVLDSHQPKPDTQTSSE